MSVAVNLYLPGRSWLHRTDPRVKLFFVATFLFLLILFKNLWFMFSALLLLHFIHWTAGTPWAKISTIWKTLLPVGLLMFLLRVIFYPLGEPIFVFWFLKVTLLAMAQGAVLALRILTMAFVVFAWLFTTPQSDLVQSLVKLGLPHEWGLVLALALRYIPTFQAMYTLISEAQQARGLNIGRHKGFKRVRVMMPIFVAMIISSLRASGHLAMALEARGYGQNQAKRSTLYALRFHLWDYGLTLALLLMLLSLSYLNIRFGLGAQPIALY